MTPCQVMAYWACQLAGGIAAGFSINLQFGRGFELGPIEDHAVGAILAEFLYTLMLCLVVLNTAVCSTTLQG